MEGITIAGLATGIGGSMHGISISGLGTGVGGTAHGASIAGLGLGLMRAEILAVAPVVVVTSAKALIVAPLMFRAKDDATGVFIGAVNSVTGKQHGLSIGVLNYARTLSGVQIGVLNIVADGKGPKVLPVVNWR
jgi:hypothetical protein